MKNLTKAALTTAALFVASAGMAGAAPGTLMSDRAGSVSRTGLMLSDRAGTVGRTGLLVSDRSGSVSRAGILLSD
ncbi:hypothetical protein [Deinococcus sp.]|uniref:hypothetical protein n=1 Tax=Deinococcus sp. TaxID=47478 RepID=UPI002869D147|nr:hypothetical protein [Deinococcus sp.]